MRFSFSGDRSRALAYRPSKTWPINNAAILQCRYRDIRPQLAVVLRSINHLPIEPQKTIACCAFMEI
jgi:hypothetical protein